MTAPTPRQIEALHAIYIGRHPRDRVEDGRWRHGGSSMGGAIGRMVDRMGEAGWLVQRESDSGRIWTERRLTAAGLIELDRHVPGLPGMAERLEEVERAEADAIAAQLAAEDAALLKAKEEREAREAAKPDAMRDVLQLFQVRHDLGDEQLAAMFDAVVAKGWDL